VQLAEKLAVHSPWHDAVKLIGVQLAVQPPETSTVHSALASTSMLPQSLMSPSLSSPD